MANSRNELKAGAFIIITFALAVVIVVWVKGARMGPVQSRVVEFKLSDDLGGLQVGDDVRLGGFKVGVVRNIHPSGLSGNDPKLLVEVSLPGQYVLHSDTAIGIQTGITGTTNLNITDMGHGSALPEGAHLPGKPDPKTALFASLGSIAPHLESTMTQLDTQTVPKVTQTVDQAKTLLAHANTKVEPIVERYNKVADNASAAMAQVDGLLGDTKPDLRGTIKNLNVATGAIKDKLPGIMDQVTVVVGKVNTSLDTAQAALRDVKDTTSNLRSVIVDNRGKLDGIITGIKTTSDNLKEASIELRHSPWRLLYKPTPEEAGNINLYDSARAFAEGAGSLSDASTALRDALHNPNADRAQIQKLIDELDTSFNHFQQVENKLWTTAKP